MIGSDAGRAHILIISSHSPEKHEKAQPV